MSEQAALKFSWLSKRFTRACLGLSTQKSLDNALQTAAKSNDVHGAHLAQELGARLPNAVADFALWDESDVASFLVSFLFTLPDRPEDKADVLSEALKILLRESCYPAIEKLLDGNFAPNREGAPYVNTPLFREIIQKAAFEHHLSEGLLRLTSRALSEHMVDWFTEHSPDFTQGTRNLLFKALLEFGHGSILLTQLIERDRIDELAQLLCVDKDAEHLSASHIIRASQFAEAKGNSEALHLLCFAYPDIEEFAAHMRTSLPDWTDLAVQEGDAAFFCHLLGQVFPEENVARFALPITGDLFEWGNHPLRGQLIRHVSDQKREIHAESPSDPSP